MFDSIFIFKLVLTFLIGSLWISVATLLAEKFGPKIGGVIGGMPSTIVKRLIDIVVSVFGLIVLMPLFLVIALCIKLEDGGDILHFREIIGYQGKRFFALKFRTMIPNADTYFEQHPELLREYQQNVKLQIDILTRLKDG